MKISKSATFFAALVLSSYSTAALAATAKAELQSRNDSSVKGTIEFTDTADGLQVKYKISGLGKDQNHGFHIHEKGDCSSKDAKSAGPHYLKVAETGGTSMDFPQKFAGDMPQIKSDSKGNAEGSFVVKDISVNQKNPIDGRAVIVHGGPDDISKKSAPRVACGQIQSK